MLRTVCIDIGYKDASFVLIAASLNHASIVTRLIIALDVISVFIVLIVKTLMTAIIPINAIIVVIVLVVQNWKIRTIVFLMSK
jgi:hypothetical protein